ncbi:MAG TPA: hypothetical protein VGK90_14150 [Rhizomicrobium sp.]
MILGEEDNVKIAWATFLSVFALMSATDAAPVGPRFRSDTLHKSSPISPGVTFLRGRFGYSGDGRACTVREYLSAHLHFIWDNGVDAQDNKKPPVRSHLLLIYPPGNDDVRKPLQLGAIEFPAEDPSKPDLTEEAVGPWTEANDWRAFWSFVPFDNKPQNPDELTTQPNYIANTRLLPRDIHQDATTYASVTSRWVKVNASENADAGKVCRTFPDSCPCVDDRPL